MESYEAALTAAGATVHAFKAFGSYQGEWYAYVTYKGDTGWVNGSYGSCSGCDAFQAEFDYTRHKHGDDYVWADDIEKWTPETCDACATLRERMAAFGATYLERIMTQEEAIAEATRYMWDMESDNMAAFIRSNTAQ
jgi:hypothetical protein